MSETTATTEKRHDVVINGGGTGVIATRGTVRSGELRRSAVPRLLPGHQPSTSSIVRPRRCWPCTARAHGRTEISARRPPVIDGSRRLHGAAGDGTQPAGQPVAEPVRLPGAAWPTCLVQCQTHQGWSLIRLREQVLKVAATVTVHARQITMRLGVAANRWWPSVLKALP